MGEAMRRGAGKSRTRMAPIDPSPLSIHNLPRIADLVDVVLRRPVGVHVSTVVRVHGGREAVRSGRRRVALVKKGTKSWPAPTRQSSTVLALRVEVCAAGLVVSSRPSSLTLERSVAWVPRTEAARARATAALRNMVCFEERLLCV